MHLDEGNPRYEYRLREEPTESSPAEKDFNQGGNGFNMKEGRCTLSVRKTFLLTGVEALAVLPRELWVPHPWRYPRPGWMGPGQPELVGGSPAHGRG